MSTIYGLSWQWNVVTPTTNLGTWQSIAGALQTGLLEFGRVVGKANLIGATGGTLDVALQTGIVLPGTNIVAPGSWKDIWRVNQLAGGAGAISWDIVFSRATTAAAATPTQVNPTDATPTIAVNTVNGQSMQDALRLMVLPGAGTTAGAALVFTFDASP
jgi:hypothetical protein